MKTSSILLTAMTMILAASCAPREPKRVEEQRLEAAKGFQPITYRRFKPGLAAQDTITITEAGVLTTSGPSFGNATGQITDFQKMQLIRLFDGWDKLQPAYPAPPNAPESYTIEIQWGPRKVSASEVSKDTPDPFTQARRQIESLTRNLPAK